MLAVLFYDYIMDDSDKFIKEWNRVIADWRSGILDLYLAAEKVHTSAHKYLSSFSIHPMLSQVIDLSLAIAEDYRSEEDNEADWSIIVQTIEDYGLGNWKATSWLLSATYGVYGHDRLLRSYGVTLYRQNGTVVIKTASSALQKAMRQLSVRINPEQTDERFLQNMAMLAYKDVCTFRLMSICVEEYL